MDPFLNMMKVLNMFSKKIQYVPNLAFFRGSLKSHREPQVLIVSRGVACWWNPVFSRWGVSQHGAAPASLPDLHLTPLLIPDPLQF